MDIKKLRTFCLVARLESISAAARAARLTQPAVSQHLKALEQVFGERLFDRRRQGVTLTDTGKVVLAHATEIVAHYERAHSEIQKARGVPHGQVSLGLPTTVAATVSAKLIRRMAIKYPQVRLRIVESMSGHLREWVDAGRVELAVLFESADASTSDGEVLLVEGLYLVGSGRDSRFSGQKTIKAGLLSGFPLILPGPPHALRLLIDRFAALNDIELDINFELDATGAMRELVADDMAYTILPLPAIQQDILSGRLAASLIVSPNLERRLTFCRSPMHPYSRALQVVREELVTVLSDISADGGWKLVTTAEVRSAKPKVIR